MKIRFSRTGCLVLALTLLASMALCVVGVFLGGVVNKKAMMPEISLAAEEIPLPFSLPLFGNHIPNTLPATWLTMLLLILLGLSYRRALRRKGSTSRLVVAVEAIGEGMLRFMEGAVGEKARMFFPLVATFFLFIALSNWCGILPGFSSIGVWVTHHAEGAGEAAHEEGHEVLVPFFRSANAHLSTTLALAIVSVAAAQYFGVRVSGKHYWRRYLNFRATSPKPDPATQSTVQRLISKFARGVEALVNGIVGLLEAVLEALKVLPFSFRLFGNIFAGEVLLFVVSYLFTFVFPVIFLGLELFVGLLQGVIFSMLTLVFFSIATTSHHEEAQHH